MRGRLLKRGAVWHFRYTNPEGKTTTVSTGLEDKNEAQLWSTEFLAELNQPKRFVTIADVLDLWERKKAKEGGDMKKGYSNLRRLRKAFGDVSPYDIRKSVDAYIERRQGEVADSTISRELSDLKAALTWAHNPRGGGLLTKAPDKVWFNVKSGVRTTVATVEQLQRLAEAIEEEEPYVRTAFYLAVGTAQRVGAVLDLTTDRVRWDLGHLDFNNPNLRGKRKGRSTVLIPDELTDMLKHACDTSQSGYVVERSGRKVSKSILHHAWISARKKAGVEHLWWHDLRRTWATMAARERVDMIQISRQLGHSSIRITEQHYAHFHPDYMGEAQKHAGRMLQNFVKRP